MKRPPLRIHFLYHPASTQCQKLALELYRRFMATGSGTGLRIPITFASVHPDHMPPEDLKLKDADRNLVVALIDSRMALRARGQDRKVAARWAELLTKLVCHPGGDGPQGALPIAVDQGAFGLAPELSARSFVRLDRVDDKADRKVAELCFHVAAAALQLLRDQALPAEPTEKAPITLFISHAKEDLKSGQAGSSQGSVVELLNYLGTGPVNAWFDAKQIPGGARFDEALEQGIIHCDVVICVLTDRWSDREWCRREAIIAKRMATPLVILDALNTDVPRLFPYVGNARLVRWQPGNPQVVVLAALLESLRYCYAVTVLTSRKQEGDYILGVPPEALTLRRVPPGTKRVVYPDPPLPREELEEISPVFVMAGSNAAAGDATSMAHPGTLFQPVELTTPLTQIARWNRPPELDMVGLSLSGAKDINSWGASHEHLTTLADDLVTMLLLAGLRLAYGGALDHGGSMNDEVNYTRRLFGLVRSYSPLAKNLGSTRFHPIVNFVPWPVPRGYGDKELVIYGQEATLEEGPAPELGSALSELAPDANGFFPWDSWAQKWAYARGLTAMRRQMGQRISARIALAGKLEGYSGLLPGVLEEILITRCGDRPAPLYLIGAFGGATRYAIDLLESRPREESTTAWVHEHVPNYAPLAGEYRKHNDKIITPEEAAKLLGDLGKAGPEKALGNGLSDADNRELFETTDSYRIVELILDGLRAWFSKLPT